MSVADGPLGAPLEQVWRDTRALETGEVATCIPELENADPATSGLSLATLDGHVYDVGDQLALVDRGRRSARVVALEPRICHILSVEAHDDPQKNAPAAAAALTLAIARLLSGRLRYATADLAASDEI